MAGCEDGWYGMMCDKKCENACSLENPHTPGSKTDLEQNPDYKDAFKCNQRTGSCLWMCWHNSHCNFYKYPFGACNMDFTCYRGPKNDEKDYCTRVDGLVDGDPRRTFADKGTSKAKTTLPQRYRGKYCQSLQCDVPNCQKCKAPKHKKGGSSQNSNTGQNSQTNEHHLANVDDHSYECELCVYGYWGPSCQPCNQGMNRCNYPNDEQNKMFQKQGYKKAPICE